MKNLVWNSFGRVWRILTYLFGVSRSEDDADSAAQSVSQRLIQISCTRPEYKRHEDETPEELRLQVRLPDGDSTVRRLGSDLPAVFAKDDRR